MVTSLATLLIAIPLMRPSTDSWTVKAIVRHAEAKNAEQIARQELQSAAENTGVLPGHASEADRKALQASFATSTEPNGNGSFVTSLQFRHGDQKQARELLNQVAYGLAEAAGDQAQVVSIEAQPIGGIPRGKLFAVMVCSLTVGLTTIFFPRRRAKPTESNADKLEQVTNATGLPIIGSVMSTPPEKVKKKSSNFPLRLTAFAGELVVASALIFTLFGAATDTNLLSRMIESPLEGYAQSIRTASTQFQSVLQR
jgi:hypothetical protein